MSGHRMKVVVLGASGLLGSTMFRVLSAAGEIDAIGAIRSTIVPEALLGDGRARIRSRLDMLDQPALTHWLEEVRPEVVINCVGLVKQRPEANDEDLAMAVNAELPHRLAAICKTLGARLIHFSTDCVFSGREGRYTETSLPDCTDLYGRSKLLGEVRGEGMLTLRTSMIGPELNTRRGLLRWFQGQSGPVRGYTNMVFSGPTSLEIARVVKNHVLPARDLSGLYHLSAAPISQVRPAASDRLGLRTSHRHRAGRRRRDRPLPRFERLPGGHELRAARLARPDPGPQEFQRTAVSLRRAGASSCLRS